MRARDFVGDRETLGGYGSDAGPPQEDTGVEGEGGEKEALGRLLRKRDRGRDWRMTSVICDGWVSQLLRDAGESCCWFEESTQWQTTVSLGEGFL